MFVPPCGSAKIQNSPYEKWIELREIETKQDFIDFAQENEGLFRGSIAENGSSADGKDLFERGIIRKNNDFLYFSELLKSPILRGGGSSIMSWGCWYENPDAESVSCKLHADGPRVLEIAGMSETVPLSYSISLDSETFGELKRATTRINGAIFEQCPSKKLIGRADYVLISDDDGEVKFGLVDVGESNLTLALADEIFNSFGIRADMGLLKYYVDSVISESEARLGRHPETICLVAENQKMIDNMPYEFLALKYALRERLSPNPCKIDITHKEDPNVRSARYDLWVRSFRQLVDGDAEFWTNGIESQGSVILDDPRAIPFYSKGEIARALRREVKYLPASVIVPRSEAIPLSWDWHGLSKDIFAYAKEEGYTDFVVKPSEKMPKSSTAYFYNADNKLHQRQLEKSLRKLINLGAKNVIVEEALGNGAVGGRKAEIRVYCLG